MAPKASSLSSSPAVKIIANWGGTVLGLAGAAALLLTLSVQ